MKQYFVTSTGTTSLGRGETPFPIDAPQDVGIERDTLSLNIQVRRLPGGPETSNSAASQQIQVTVFFGYGVALSSCAVEEDLTTVTIPCFPNLHGESARDIRIE